MRISVVTPSFNMARYLDETMASVGENLAPGDEYFVIDGGSTDGSVEIIRRHETKLAVWVSEPDCGYADSLAKGFARERGYPVLDERRRPAARRGAGCRPQGDRRERH